VCAATLLLLFYLNDRQKPTHESQARRRHIDMNLYIVDVDVCVHSTGFSRIPSFNLSDNHKRTTNKRFWGLVWVHFDRRRRTPRRQSTTYTIDRLTILRSYDLTIVASQHSLRKTVLERRSNGQQRMLSLKRQKLPQLVNYKIQNTKKIKINKIKRVGINGSN